MGLKPRSKPAPAGDTDTIKIGTPLLVIDKLQVDRAVTYSQSGRKTKKNPDGSERDEWMGQAQYRSREETQEAGRVYQAARQRIRSLCVHTDLGFMCASDKENEVREAVRAAKELIAEANARWTHCAISGRISLTRVLAGDKDSAESVKAKLDETTTKIREALREFDAMRARRALNATKELVNILQDPAAKVALQESREQARTLAQEIADLVKEFDGKDNALASEAGQKVLDRAKAAWNF